MKELLVEQFQPVRTPAVHAAILTKKIKEIERLWEHNMMHYVVYITRLFPAGVEVVIKMVNR